MDVLVPLFALAVAGATPDAKADTGLGPVRDVRIVIDDGFAGEGPSVEKPSEEKPAIASAAWPVNQRHTVRQSGTSGQASTPFAQNFNAAASQVEQGFQQASQGFQQASQGFQGGLQQINQGAAAAQNAFAQPLGNQPAAPSFGGQSFGGQSFGGQSFAAQPIDEPRKSLGSEALKGVNRLRKNTRNAVRNTVEAFEGTARNAREGLRSVLVGDDPPPAPVAAPVGGGGFVPFSYNNGATAAGGQPGFGAAQPAPTFGANQPAPTFGANPVLTNSGVANPRAPVGQATPPRENQPFTTQPIAGSTPAADYRNAGAAPDWSAADSDFRFTPAANQSGPVAADPSKSMAPGPPPPLNNPPRGNPPLGNGGRFVSQPADTGTPFAGQSPFVPLGDSRNGARSPGGGFGDDLVRVRPTASTDAEPTSAGVDPWATAGSSGPTGPAFPQTDGSAGRAPDQSGFADWGGGQTTTQGQQAQGQPSVGQQPFYPQPLGGQSGPFAQQRPFGPQGGQSGLAPPNQSPGLAPIGGQGYGNQAQVNQTLGNQTLAAGQPSATVEPPSMLWLFLTTVGCFGSIAGNFFLGWSYLDARNKYQSALRRTVRTFSREPSAA